MPEIPNTPSSPLLMMTLISPTSFLTTRSSQWTSLLRSIRHNVTLPVMKNSYPLLPWSFTSSKAKLYNARSFVVLGLTFLFSSLSTLFTRFGHLRTIWLFVCRTRSPQLPFTLILSVSSDILPHTLLSLSFPPFIHSRPYSPQLRIPSPLAPSLPLPVLVLVLCISITH